MMNHREKITVGMSGGVDSAVAALILKRQGYDVSGLFMKNWRDNSIDERCIWEQDVEDVMHTSMTLDIPVNTIDLSDAYREKVFVDFLEEYKNGRTPNPDISCNREIKFKAFLQHAVDSGAEKIATGHHARIKKSRSHYQLMRGRDQNKDQSYFLYGLNQKQLASSLFPIGEFNKKEVRSFAKQAKFRVHDKKDSTGICFIGERPFKEFLSRYLPPRAGEIQTPEGKVIGQHDGVFYYTLGQRKGLGIGGVRDSDKQPWYIYKKDLQNNILFVVQGYDHELLYSWRLLARELNWISEARPETPLRCTAKTRYRQPDQACTITAIDKDSCHVVFAQAQRVITPGQSVVFYDGEICLGGGIIGDTGAK